MHNGNIVSTGQILNLHIDICSKFSVKNVEKYRYTKNRLLYRYFHFPALEARSIPCTKELVQL